MDKGPIEIEITKASPKITALFVPLKENRFTLTVLPSKGGVVNSSPSSNVYTNGDEVTFTATASAGYSFSSWTGDIESTDNPLVTLADANKTIQPVFTPNVFAPVVLKVNAINGEVIRNPAHDLYEEGTTVKLEAKPKSGYQF